jgi:hypothetical protein
VAVLSAPPGIILAITFFILLLVLFVRGHWRGDWSRRRIRKAFDDMDALDAREAPEPEYAPLMGVLGQGLPAWAASFAADRLADSEYRSRRRCLNILSQSDYSPFRERLVDLARDSTDALAAEIWEMLTGRHRSAWKEALQATEGRARFADPPPPASGPWCGYYIQLAAEHRMEFTLHVKGDALSGGGSDIVGPYTLSGEIGAGGAVEIRKQYRRYLVRYVGRFEGDAIAGNWNLVGGIGKFKLWPRRQSVPPPLAKEDRIFKDGRGKT